MKTSPKTQVKENAKPYADHFCEITKFKKIENKKIIQGHKNSST